MRKGLFARRPRGEKCFLKDLRKRTKKKHTLPFQKTNAALKKNSCHPEVHKNQIKYLKCAIAAGACVSLRRGRLLEE